ncbi:MAG: caspase family protein, partial [Chloroflexi bacterium]|nr:caspase family protein [Chloroflexota bacterium]
MPTQKQPSQEVSSTGKRLALVVGNNGKPEPGRDALKYATQSARDIAEVLQDRCSFELLQPPLLDEPTHTMRDAICDLVENRGADDFLLFYFCGHGEPLFIETEQRDVYLVSQDFNPQRVENIDKDAHISFSWLSKVLYEKSHAGIVLIMLDCCYAGNAGYQQEEQPVEALKQSIQKCFDSYLGAAENSRGVRITLAATSYNGTTCEQDGYSVLAWHLLRVL